MHIEARSKLQSAADGDKQNGDKQTIVEKYRCDSNMSSVTEANSMYERGTVHGSMAMSRRSLALAQSNHSGRAKPPQPMPQSVMNKTEDP